MLCLWVDYELERLYFRVNPRAKRMGCNVKPDAIYVTVPPGLTWEMAMAAIELARPRLLVARQKIKRSFIDWGFRIDTECFHLKLAPGDGNQIRVRVQGNKARVICPWVINFRDYETQDRLHEAVVESLRRAAKRFLPSRLESLSRQSGLSCLKVRVTSSKGKWGSCWRGTSINLSCYLMKLPSHLIDYVILHELCHTKEMNHGERFWTLLDVHTQHKAIELREELRTYTTIV